MAKHAPAAAADTPLPLEQPPATPAYFSPASAAPPPSSVPVYASPPPPQMPYQYSSPYGFSPAAAYYQPPLYMQPGMQWPQQPFPYYAPPQVWGQDADGKRAVHAQHPAHAHHAAQHHPPPPPPHLPHPQMHQPPLHHAPQPHHVPHQPPHMLQHQQHHHMQHQPHQQHHPQQHMSYVPRQPPHSYAYAAGARDHPQDHSTAGARVPTSPHAKRGGGRRRSGPVQNSSVSNGASAPNSAASTPSKSRPPARSPPMKNDGEDIEEATRNLNTQASQAVASADEVTLALLLTSWASSLEEAQKLGSSTAFFQNAFDASNALEVVSESILFMQISPDSAVQKALISLYGFVLYGDEGMHRKVAEQARSLRDVLASKSNGKSEGTDVDLIVTNLDSGLHIDPSAKSWNMASQGLTVKQAAVYKVLHILRNIANNVNAYNGILPVSIVGRNRNSTGGNVGQSNLSPAGPDPTKVVERSMNEWRRACARLQGEMAIVVVLEEALSGIDEQLSAPPGSTKELAQFFGAVSDIVKSGLKSDIEQRGKTLRETWWASVATGDATAVFEAVDTRSCVWRGLFQDSLSELEGQLNTIGLGFGPAARVSHAKVPSLVSASAGVAALVSTHRQALDWCQETSELLTVMTVAFRALAETHGGSYRPPKGLIQSFLDGVNRASAAIVEVQDWSFDPVHTKILGSLQKSAANLGAAPPRQKGIRFEEPDKSELVRKSSTDSNREDVNGGEGSTGQQRRRKPRHARMKSSPDELLHLNAHLDPHLEDGDPRAGSTDKLEDVDSSGNGEDMSPQKGSCASNDSVHFSPPGSIMSIATGCTDEGGSNGYTNDGVHQRNNSARDEELPVVYEEKMLEYEGDDEDDDDRHIVVREDVEESNGPKKITPNPKSHVRSMSVDGIPF